MLNTNTSEKSISTTCCVVGGGPAGMMVAFLLARAGVEVIVLEKHKDFFRDFRGDTIHPSTFELLNELGILQEFQKIPHQEMKFIQAKFNDKLLRVADFSQLPVRLKAIGLMPQWDFLNFIRDKALKYRGFHLMMETTVIRLIQDQGEIAGIHAMTPEGPIDIRASLVIGADGRHSDVRTSAGLRVVKTGAPIDGLWFRLTKNESDPGHVLGYFRYGRLMIMLDRGDYWQCGFIIPKDGFERLKADGLDSFKNELLTVASFLKDRVSEIYNWDQIRLLSVEIDHLEKWYSPGLLCIGDAAHAMSPVGGVGINLALQDAVAAANLLWHDLKYHQRVGMDVLAQVQKRRLFPARITQRIQVRIQNGIITRKTSKALAVKAPFLLRYIHQFPFLQRFIARMVGLGVRPEHIQSPESGEDQAG